MNKQFNINFKEFPANISFKTYIHPFDLYDPFPDKIGDLIIKPANKNSKIKSLVGLIDIYTKLEFSQDIYKKIYDLMSDRSLPKDLRIFSFMTEAMHKKESIATMFTYLSNIKAYKEINCSNVEWYDLYNGYVRCHVDNTISI